SGSVWHVAEVSGSLTPVRRRRPRRRRRLRKALVSVLLVAAALAVAGVAAALLTGGGKQPAAVSTEQAKTAARQHRRAAPHPLVLEERPTGSLASAVQDEAIARVAGGAMLLGGLTDADQSRADVRIASIRADRAAG